jgi:hypothetical protein
MDARNLSSYRIAHVVGARPQFVKLKPLVEAIQRLGGVNWVAHTGQHYDSHMNASFWDELGVAPDYHGTWIGVAVAGRNCADGIGADRPARRAARRNREDDWQWRGNCAG